MLPKLRLQDDNKDEQLTDLFKQNIQEETSRIEWIIFTTELPFYMDELGGQRSVKKCKRSYFAVKEV